MSHPAPGAWPLDVTFIMPVQFEPLGGPSGDPTAAVNAALERPGHHWKAIDPVRRGDPPELDGFAFGEFAYFHPYFQKFIYKDSCRVYQFDTILAQRLHVEAPKLKITFEIRNVLLYVFEHGIGMLVTELRLPNDREATWGEALLFTAEVRKAYYSHYYRGEDGEWNGGGGIAEVCIEPLQAGYPKPAAGQIHQQFVDTLDLKTPRLFPHWRALLSPLSGDEPSRFRLLGDNRLPTMAFIGTADISKLSPDDWEALAQADGADYARYAPEFRDRELERAVYDRWFDPASGVASHRQRYVAGPLNFCTVLEVDPANPPGFLFGSRERWRRHYFVIYLFAVYQMSALRVIQSRIARASDLLADAAKPGAGQRQRVKDALAAVQDAQLRLARFSSRAWFLEVTPQIQGQELYAKMRAQFRLEALYREVTEDKKILSEWVMAQDTLLREQWRDNLEKFALIFVVATVLVTALGMSVIWEPLRTLILHHAHDLAQNWPYSRQFEQNTSSALHALLADIAMIIPSSLFAWWIYTRLKRKVEAL
jgi:hypothetical protein